MRWTIDARIHRMTPSTRREVLGASAGLAITTLGLPLTTLAQDQPTGKTSLKVVVVGGHPDDPESGCGGTVARLADLGHDVALLYLTRGEAGVRGKSHDEAAQIRSAEAIEACKILKARPLFAGQIDGAAEVNPERYEAFCQDPSRRKAGPGLHPMADRQPPRSPRAPHFWRSTPGSGRPGVPLYYYEVEAGSQTTMFRPTHYVDITAVEDENAHACFAHKSQDPQGFYTSTP